MNFELLGFLCYMVCRWSRYWNKDCWDGVRSCWMIGRRGCGSCRWSSILVFRRWEIEVCSFFCWKCGKRDCKGCLFSWLIYLKGGEGNWICYCELSVGVFLILR